MTLIHNNQPKIGVCNSEEWGGVWQLGVNGWQHRGTMVRSYDGGMMAGAQWHRDCMIVQGKYVEWEQMNERTRTKE